MDWSKLFRDYWYFPAGAAAAATLAIGFKKINQPATPVTPPATPKSPITPVVGAPLTGYLSNAFFTAVHDLAAHAQSKGAKVTGEDFLEIFLAESDADPRIKNSIGCAGLNQICNLKKVGWTGTVEEYLALPGEKQLAYVQRYFDNTNSYPVMVDVGSLYLANFSPAFFAPPSNAIWGGRYPIMYQDPKRGGTGKLDSSYTANAGVDTGNKGYIELADMAKFVHRASANPKRAAKWNELRARLASSQVGV